MTSEKFWYKSKQKEKKTRMKQCEKIIENFSMDIFFYKKKHIMLEVYVWIRNVVNS